MKERMRYVIIGLMAWLLLYGCIKDESSGFRTEGSPITITTDDTVYYQDFGTSVLIDPEVTQSQPDLPLVYEWKFIATDGGASSDSLRLIGTDKVLDYKFPRSGIFRVRLRVENQYGSSFKFFQVHVQAPFEQGILVLSNDQSDVGRLSFLRLKEEDEVLSKKESDFNLNAFKQSNPGVTLHGLRDAIISYISQVSQSETGSGLVVSSETDQVLYCLNAQNFLIENQVDVRAYCPEMYPTTLFGSDYAGISEVLFASNDVDGNPDDIGVFEVEGFIARPRPAAYNKFDKAILGIMVIEGWSILNYVACLVDNTHSEVHSMENGSVGKWNAGDRFTGEYIVNVSFLGTSGCLVFITQDKNDPSKIRIHKTIDDQLEFESGIYEYTLAKEMTLTHECQMCSNDKYKHIYYYKDNKLYRWVYMANEPKLPEKPDFEFADENDEITCIACSPNEEHIYVCVYNPNATTELKGRLLILNADTLEVEKEYKGISDKALKVMWKVSV